MINPGSAPKLVATDVDGTLINSSERVPQRLREVITRMTAQGVTLALSTGRPPRWIHLVLDQLSVQPICVCANGAVLYDSAKDEIIAAHTLSSAVMKNTVMAARVALESHGGMSIAVERAGKSAYDAAEELFLVTPEYSHAWPSDEHGIVSEDEVLAEPATKLLLRSDHLESKELFDIVRAAVPVDQVHVTFSMSGGLIEIAAPGVTKALGVSMLAEQLNIAREDVITFGDMPNDIEMLQWAGRGIAMGNARPEVKAVADHITGTNDDAGVADILEWWF
ncbi:Cof-type HAD-IIB family hydrolase [Corynebacterium crudilactis]|uniref:HAD family hydrolase n=1 Tax=Corynebacterium crudilactis TaxID=1652495 RepID=A0A172QWG5_9CORY|nr:Cof-type HAD-IIB family hydrolase [Corynebacterium crudilactis]ANE05053.1 HAD family hydrolase [Corynebacterium crudilactis]